MRTSTAAILLSLLLAGSSFAQDPAGQRRAPPGFETAQVEEYGQAEQAAQNGFRSSEYGLGIPPLRKQIAILDEVRARVEADDFDFGELDRDVVRRRYQEWHQAHWYNLACCLAMTGKKAEAIDAVAKAIDLGYTNLDHMGLDTDLDPIRQEPGFREAIALLSYNSVFEVHVPSDLGPGPHELIVALHDARRDEKSAIERWKAMADERGSILVAPRAPITRELGKYDWKRYCDDEAAGLGKIRFAIETVKGDHPVDPKRILVIGEGEGGYFASLFALISPDLVAGAVPINAYWNRYYFADFFDLAKENGVSICFVHGLDDPFRKKAEEGRSQLEKAGIAVSLIEYEGNEELPENVSALVKKAADFVGAN